MRKIVVLIFVLAFSGSSYAADISVQVGAEQMDAYLPLLQNKKVGLVANHTSLVNGVHLLDTLRSQGVDVIRVFAPEHGFRGAADAGENVSSYVDSKTNVEVTSIYGASKKPSGEQLRGVQVMVFDMQDVGARFFTYLSTMHYVMEACAENNIPFIVLDRPNPNGYYIDGPVLKPQFRSFVGMHPIPIVHGMTLGELARMINGEGWLKETVKCTLTVIPCKNYKHSTRYNLPVKPSPNLPNMRAVYLYPSLCLFEGTIMSVGRGTDTPFQIFGFPEWKTSSFLFIPRSIEGAAKHPPYENISCGGVDLSQLNIEQLSLRNEIDLGYLLESYKRFGKTQKFFTSFFAKLAGTDKLQKQIEQGWNAKKIRASWKPELEKFKKQRAKYLLYAE